MGELEIYKYHIPNTENDSVQQRVEKVTRYLAPRTMVNGKPALLVFVLSLRNRYDDGDATKKELEDLASEISKESASTIPTMPDEEQILQLNEERDLQLANQQIQSQDSSFEIVDWFEACGDNLEEKSFRATLAVLNGARYSSVLEASSRLTNFLSKDIKDIKPTTGEANPFSNKGRSGRLEYSELMDTKNSFSERVKTIQYKNTAFAYKILEYVWQEYDSPKFRGPFIDWLTEIAASHQFDIRNRAAIAVGTLAQIDFPDIRDLVLFNWVKKDDRIYRAAIGKVLGKAVQDDKIADEIVNMLDNWAKSNDERFIWAANRAYSNIGIKFTEKAFQQWIKTFQSTNRLVEYEVTPTLRLSLINPILMSVVDSMLSLLLTATTMKEYEQVYEVALQELLSCAKSEPERSKSNLGLSLFLVCTNLAAREINSEDDDNLNDAIEVPAMLKIINNQNNNKYRQVLCELVFLSLKYEPTRMIITEALHSWLYWMNETKYESNLLAMFSDVVLYSIKEKSRVGERLILYCKEWGRRIPLAQKAYQMTVSSNQP